VQQRFAAVPGGAPGLDGMLATVLVQGGAYHRYDGSARDAKDIAAAAVDALTGRRYEDFRLDVSFTDWTPWSGRGPTPSCSPAWPRRRSPSSASPIGTREVPGAPAARDDPVSPGERGAPSRRRGRAHIG
jgi:hypothetical protein